MSTSADPGESWAVGIEAELGLVAEARRNTHHSDNHPTMFRVPSCIKELKPQAYEHQVLSFGLYDRNFDKPTLMDQVRLQVVSEFFEQLKAMPHSRVHSWEELCVSVAGPVESAQQLRQLYDDGTGESLVSSTTARSVLTFDAVFLTVLLIIASQDVGEPQLPNFERLRAILFDKAAAFYIALMFYDLWLLENQIPLSLVRQVWKHVYVDASNPPDHRFNIQLRRTIFLAVVSYLRWDAKFVESSAHYNSISLTECDHLLHCMYKVVCLQNLPKSELQAGRRTQSSTKRVSRSLPSVTELYKAGIIVRGEMGGVSDFRFVKSTFYEATLYLPQIDVDDGTERLLRNLAAFEMLHNEGESHLVSFLSIMDDLINTEEDVRLLRKGRDPVIHLNQIGDDRNIAALFNGLCENVWIGGRSEQYSELMRDVNEWCMQEKRQMFIRFVDRFFDKPWILASLAAATLLLLMTALQTFYTVKGFYQ